MGIRADSAAAAAESLRALKGEQRGELVPPVRVVSFDDERCRDVALRLRASTAAAHWEYDVVEEDGTPHHADGRAAPGQRTTFQLPRLPIGYHRLRVRVTRGRRELEAEQSLIIVPPRCTSPGELLGGERAFGVVANLYTVHSERNWGIGDLTDLATLSRWAGSVGADFVGVNPLHALLNRGADISPYSPVSRLFRNVAYLDVEAIPELRDAPAVARRIASPAFQAELSVLRERRRVDYEQCAYLKMAALEELFAIFRDRLRNGGGARAQSYREWVTTQEPELTTFATWMAMEERGTRDAGRGSAGTPPADRLPPPDSEEVLRFQREHADAIEFHKWLQFELDRQLGTAADTARRAGLRIGIYQDLAIGTSPAGSDAWAYGHLFVRAASIGAPPDPYSETGQHWGLPPIDPRRLRADGYRYFVRLLRNGFRHSGALRIDHVMGLFRLYWIPEGLTGKEGAYVRMPSEDLLGILALESVRHKALVVGEDLGTVPKEVPPALRRWGVLSSKVLYFERDKRGGFRRAENYEPLALATANTHDMATLAGFFSGHDIGLRAKAGLLPNEQAVREAKEERQRDIDALRALLSNDTTGGGGREAVSEPEQANASLLPPTASRTGAIHEFLCHTPSVLVGLALDDLTGEEEAVNLPGVGPDRYPSWTRKMHTPIEALGEDLYVRAALRCDRGQRGTE